MIGDRWRSTAARHGERLAIVDGAQRITYSELIGRIAAVRRWIRTALDPQPRDVIAVAIENSWQLVACFFALADLGCIMMPCNPQWRAAELRPLGAKLRFGGAIVATRVHEEWSQISDLIPQAQLLQADAIPARADSPSKMETIATAHSDENDAVLYVTTSGSTGTPRVVPRTHENLMATPNGLGTAVGVTPDCVFLSVVPAHHFYGFSSSLLLPLLSGAASVIMPSFNPRLCAELIHAERVNMMFVSPFIFGSLLDNSGNPALLSSLRLCVNAAGRLPEGVAERWQTRFGMRILQLYGMSEAASIAIERPGSPPIHSHGVCVGPPVDGVEVRFLSPDGATLGPGETGEVTLRSPGVISGYVGEPELNRERFVDGWFRTGDLGYMHASGNIFLTGRLGRVLNLYGVKVDPVEVERAIEMLPGVSSCHVDTVPSGAGGEMIRARVVPRPGFEITRREIIGQCRRQIAEYKFPRMIEFLKESPVTLTGKVLRARAEAPGHDPAP